MCGWDHTNFQCSFEQRCTVLLSYFWHEKIAPLPQMKTLEWAGNRACCVSISKPTISYPVVQSFVSAKPGLTPKRNYKVDPGFALIELWAHWVLFSFFNSNWFNPVAVSTSNRLITCFCVVSVRLKPSLKTTITMCNGPVVPCNVNQHYLYCNAYVLMINPVWPRI